MNKRYMNFASLALLLLVGAAVAESTADKATAPRLKNFSEALQAAEAKNQLVLVDFYTDW